MSRPFSDLVLAYFGARGYVNEYFPEDLAWAGGLAHVNPDPIYVVRETAWVILNSGFRFQVARKCWPAITEAFSGWDPARINPDQAVAAALPALKHPGKIGAMGKVVRIVQMEGHQRIVEEAATPIKLTRLPFIGKVTCYHLAKVLGADVLKPDVHLERAAKAAGFASAWELGEALRPSGDRLPVIDSVLWRWGEQQRVHKHTWSSLWGSPKR